MERNSELVDTPLTSMSQNPAQNVESTLPSQTTKSPKTTVPIPNVENQVDRGSINHGDSLNDSNDAQKQLAVYSPADSASEGTDSGPSQNQAKQIVPHVGAYTAQCSLCFKPRMIYSMEKFEEIWERSKEKLFVCADVREWRPEDSCNTDADLPDDGSFKFAIVKPNIARLPPKWKRIVKIRGTGAKFADVYYISPSGLRLRSTADVERYLRKHPDEAEGVELSQFSFQPPKPAYRLKQPSDVQG